MRFLASRSLKRNRSTRFPLRHSATLQVCHYSALHVTNLANQKPRLNWARNLAGRHLYVDILAKQKQKIIWTFDGEYFVKFFNQCVSAWHPCRVRHRAPKHTNALVELHGLPVKCEHDSRIRRLELKLYFCALSFIFIHR